MGVVEPASHLSPEAREFLTNYRIVGAELDLGDAEALAAARNGSLAGWIAHNEGLPGPWISRASSVAGVPVVAFATDEHALGADGVIVHLHGGAFVLGSPTASAALAVGVAQRTGLPVVSVDYRLAPEHPCPAGLDDIVRVCLELSASRPVVAMFGESAGANLSLAAAIALRDRGAQLPARLGLLSPWVDMTCSGDTYRSLAPADPVLGPLDPAAFAAAYAGSDTADPQASPLFGDLTGLPPSLIQAGSRETLLSDACRLDDALRRAGVEVALHVWDGLWHGWQLQYRVPEARQALDDLAGFLAG
jgi:acetyl esterase/lipase